MAQHPAKHKQPWTSQEEAQLKKFIEERKTIHEIALSLQRTEVAVRAKARELRLSLEPQSELLGTGESRGSDEPQEKSEKGWFNWRGRTSSPGADAEAPDEGEQEGDDNEDSSEVTAVGDDSHGEFSEGSAGVNGEPGGGAMG